MEVDERRFTRAIVGLTRTQLIIIEIAEAQGRWRKHTHLRHTDHAKNARHGHDMASSDSKHRWEECLEHPKLGKCIGSKCAVNQRIKMVLATWKDKMVTDSVISSSVRSSRSLPLTTPALLMMIVGSPT